MKKRTARRGLVLTLLWTLSLVSLLVLWGGLPERPEVRSYGAPGLRGAERLEGTLFRVRPEGGRYLLQRSDAGPSAAGPALGLWLLLSSPALYLTWRWAPRRRAGSGHASAR